LLKARVPHSEIVSITKSHRNGSVVYNISFADSETPELYLRADGQVMPEPQRASQ